MTSGGNNFNYFHDNRTNYGTFAPKNFRKYHGMELSLPSLMLHFLPFCIWQKIQKKISEFKWPNGKYATDFGELAGLHQKSKTNVW